MAGDRSVRDQAIPNYRCPCYHPVWRGTGPFGIRRSRTTDVLVIIQFGGGQAPALRSKGGSPCGLKEMFCARQEPLDISRS